MSIPLGRERLSAGVAEAKSMSSMADADVTAMSKMIEGEVAAAREQVLAARTRLATTREKILPLAKQALTLTNLELRRRADAARLGARGRAPGARHADGGGHRRDEARDGLGQARTGDRRGEGRRGLIEYGRAHAMAFDPGSRGKLGLRQLERFQGDTLFDRHRARACCAADCLPRKELYESWEVARRARRRFRGGRVVDLACGHGARRAPASCCSTTRSAAAIAVDMRIPDERGEARRGDRARVAAARGAGRARAERDSTR